MAIEDEQGAGTGTPNDDAFAGVDDAGQAAPERRLHVPEPDYGAADYIRLPDFGQQYYSLTDAALLSALDMWASGEAPGVPPEGLPMAEDDEEAHDHQDDPLIRAALDPLRVQLAAALVRSAEAGQLKVEVKGRNLADSRLIPERTFVHLQDLTEWLEVHGHDRGDIIADVEESEADNPWLIASAVAEDRAGFRLAHLQRESGTTVEGSRTVYKDSDGLKRELRAKSLHIAHLEQQLNAARGGSGGEVRPGTRQKRTLLTIIAALCKRAGIDPKARGAAMAIASATQELGVPVGDDSIRELLKAIPDAIESRTR